MMVVGAVRTRVEHMTIVCLSRNDISRIRDLGTLHVYELFRIESFPTVRQLVSCLRVRLAPGKTASDIVSMLFPCGSITGALNIRAIQILRCHRGHRSFRPKAF